MEDAPHMRRRTVASQKKVVKRIKKSVVKKVACLKCLKPADIRQHVQGDSDDKLDIFMCFACAERDDDLEGWDPRKRKPISDPDFICTLLSDEQPVKFKVVRSRSKKEDDVDAILKEWRAQHT